VWLGCCDRPASEPDAPPTIEARSDIDAPELVDAPDGVASTPVAPPVAAVIEAAPPPHGFALVRPGAAIHLGPASGPAPAPSITLPTGGPGFVVAAVGREGDHITVETPVDDVPNCASTLWALSAFRLQLHVAEADLVSVTTRRVAVDFGDGTRVDLLAGVPLRREGTAWIAELTGLSMSLTLPDDAVGRYYDPGDRSFGDVRPEPLASGDDRLIYDRTHEFTDAQLEQTGIDPRGVATFGRRTEAGRTLADVRLRCASIRAVVPSSRLAPVLETAVLGMMGGMAGGLIGGLGSPSTPTWQVRRGATVWWRSGGIAGLVERDHTFTAAPEVVDARRCFAVELGAGAILPLCFEAAAIEDVPGASVDPGAGLAGIGELGSVLGEGELGGGIGGLGAIGSGSGTGLGHGTKRKRPKAGTGTTTVVGSLDKDAVRRVVRRHMNEVKYCYEAGLAKDPTLEGKVTIVLTIGPSGDVSTATVKDDTLADASVGKCIAKAVARWTFPAPVGGGMVVVKYPFVLHPG
jgi:hypothetical protein